MPKIRTDKKKAGRKVIPGTVKYSDVRNWIWTYYNDTIKVFVPKQFKQKFQSFLKNNKKIKVKQHAVYKLAVSKIKIKKAPFDYVLREGKDYITDTEHTKALETWLKGAIKEYNDDIISITSVKKVN